MSVNQTSIAPSVLQGLPKALQGFLLQFIKNTNGAASESDISNLSNSLNSLVDNLQSQLSSLQSQFNSLLPMFSNLISDGTITSGTVYQNNTFKPLFVSIVSTLNAVGYIGNSSSPSNEVGSALSISFVVPPLWYWKVVFSGTITAAQVQ